MSTDIRDNGILSASRQLLSTEIEESVVYNRIDGKYVDLSMAFIDMQDPLLLLSVYEQGKSDPDDDPSESGVLSVAEARLLRDLLNRPAVAAILDETSYKVLSQGKSRQHRNSTAKRNTGQN